MTSVDAAIARYEARMRDWARSVRRDWREGEAAKDEIAAPLEEIWGTERGREAVGRLLRDPEQDPFVRVLAASHVIAWDRRAARAVLREIRDSGTEGSDFAETVLIENFGEGL